MDTDDLTEMAYETIILATGASEVLRAQIGASAFHYSNEQDFLRGALEMLDALLEDPEGYLAFWRSLEAISVPSFTRRLRRLRAHVTKTLKTPEAERGGCPFE